jgi:hypothetical protein
MRDNGAAQTGVRHSGQHRPVWTTVMTSPASAPIIAKPRMRSLSVATSAFNRHSPDSGDFGARIAPLNAFSNGNSPSSRAKGDRSRRLAAAEP